MGTFGENLRELLDETRYGTLNKLAGEIEITPSTLYRWAEHADPRVPPRVLARIARAVRLPEAEVLERLVGRKGGTVKENQERYEAESNEITTRWAQPMSDRTIAVQALGRLEHYASRIRELGDEYRARVDELAKQAQEEITAARRALMRKIEHNDRGEKV